MGFLANGTSCGHEFSGLEVPLAYCTRFLAKYKGQEAVRGCGNAVSIEEFAKGTEADRKRFQFGKFTQPQQASQELFLNIEKENLVVVMSAVDWWKSGRQEGWAAFSAGCVPWIFLERCGKTGARRVALGAAGNF